MVTKRVVKGHLLHFKRASFTTQKGTFYNAKGALLEGERWSFKNQRGVYFTKEVVSYPPITCLLRLITTLFLYVINKFCKEFVLS